MGCFQFSTNMLDDINILTHFCDLVETIYRIISQSGIVGWKGMWLENFDSYCSTAPPNSYSNDIRESPFPPSLSILSPNSKSLMKAKTFNYVLICIFKIMSEIEYLFIAIGHLYLVRYKMPVMPFALFLIKKNSENFKI